MGLIDLLRNAALVSLAGCATNQPEKDSEKFSCLYFSNSSHVRVTGHHGSPDSKKHLFHIRQMHFSLGGNREDYTLTNSSQREIYHFLRDMKSQGVDKLWVEGFDDSSFTSLQPSDNYTSVMSYLMRTGLFTSDIASGSNDSFKFVPGADVLLGMTGEYRLMPAENFFLHQRAILSFNIGCDIYENVFRSREDCLVDRIANSDEHHAFFIYGAGHNFIDNVALWNLRNPDKQMSITELTPRSLVHLKN